MREPRQTLRLLGVLQFTLRAFKYSQTWESSTEEQTLVSCAHDEKITNSSNPLKSYFDSHREGKGIWKWIHYFDIYQRHFKKFIGRDVRVLEIGVYSGGSLEMWREYFGSNCRVYGVDVEEACKVYENDRTQIFVGDQADREFWRTFKKEIPAIDILIDDGGHLPEQQIITLEEMLPHLRPGGIYLCEDVQGDINGFTSYVHGLTAKLNSALSKPVDQEKGISCSTTQFQSAIHSIHLYPFVVVIEKTAIPVNQFIAPKHGTEWQPFL